MIIDCDLTAAEWRVAAFLSQDYIMCNEIRQGFDPHQNNAETILGKGDKDSRTLAKIISFRLN